jgi:DNA processing protein
MHTLTRADFSNFESSLLQLDQVPQKLYAKSNLTKCEVLSLLNKPAVAIVGTRHPTSYGVFVTQKISTEVCELSLGEVPVVSGFMYGVDHVAHQAVVAGRGKAIAVLGYGFHQLSTRYHVLIQKVLENGGVFLSEYPPELPAQKFMFIARNRIVSALSEVLVVPEASINSGSMHTVRFSLELGQAVASVPGLITNPFAEGTKALLNQGASLVASGSDVLDLSTKFNRFFCHQNCEKVHQQSGKTSQSNDLNSLSQKVLSQLSSSPSSVTEISDFLRVSVAMVGSCLSDLELKGLILQKNGEWMLQYRR